MNGSGGTSPRIGMLFLIGVLSPEGRLIIHRKISTSVSFVSHVNVSCSPGQTMSGSSASEIPGGSISSFSIIKIIRYLSSNSQVC